MAGDWIKVRTTLPQDGRLRIVAKKCHASSVTAFGALVTLWCFVDAHATPEGELVGYAATDINELVGLPGFAEALPADWIDISGEWVKIPEYQEHNGTTAKVRAQATKRKRLERSVTPESRNDRDKSVTREEKRKEEEKDNSPVPLEAIRKAYNDALPMLPNCKKVSGEREKHLRARWNDPDRRSLDYWVEFFEYVAASDFLTGRSKSWGSWAGPDFDWLVNETNHVKVTEGKYENKVAA